MAFFVQAYTTIALRRVGRFSFASHILAKTLKDGPLPIYLFPKILTSFQVAFSAGIHFGYGGDHYDLCGLWKKWSMALVREFFGGRACSVVLESQCQLQNGKSMKLSLTLSITASTSLVPTLKV